MMVRHPSSPPELSAEGAVAAAVHASQPTPSRTEAATEEETRKNLTDILRQITRNASALGAPPLPSATALPNNDSVDALWLNVYGKRAKKQKKPENVTMTRKPTLSTPPSAWTLQTDPVGFCVYESAQLTAALEELGLAFQTTGTRKKSRTLDQLISGFSEILEGHFKNRSVRGHN